MAKEEAAEASEAAVVRVLLLAVRQERGNAAGR